MLIWWIWLSVFLICHSHCVRSQNQCHDNQQCHGLKCCLGHCTWRTFCSCRINADCPSGETCLLSNLSCRPIAAQSPKPTTRSSTTHDITSAKPIHCTRDSECKGSSVCKAGQCIDSRRSGHEVKNAWSRSEAIVAVAFVAASLTIGCLCFLCKKARSRYVLSRMRREAALNTTCVTHHEMQPGRSSVIFMDEPDSLSSPLGAPPSYSLLEFERQIDEPPSYDDSCSHDFHNASGCVVDQYCNSRLGPVYLFFKSSENFQGAQPVISI